MSWTNYALKRLGIGAFVLFGVSIVVFSIIRLVPGDPAYAIAGQFATDRTVESVREQLGLNLPIWQQYFQWMGDILQGNFGTSLVTGTPVNKLIAQRYPRSMELAFLAMIISVLVSFPAGISSAIKREESSGKTIMFLSQIGVSMPNFWLGMLFILLFAKYLNLLPPSGYVPFSQSILGNLSHAVMPALTLGLIRGAVVTRFLRSSLLEELGKDYVRTGRAYGHPERRIVGRYVMKNSLIPVVTTLGLQIGWTLGAVVVIEQVFAWPGIGRMVVSAIGSRDYPVIQAGLLVIATTFVVINLLIDLLYGWLDPKIKY